MRRIHQLLLPLLAMLFLGGCQLGETQIPALWRRLPEQPLYALRGGWYFSDNLNNALFVIDPSTWTVIRRNQLPRALSPQIDQDPMGRIWVGLGATASLLPDAKGMLVFSPNAHLIAKLETCKDPIAGVEFTADKAYVICALNGFNAQIDVFDLATLNKVDSMSLDADMTNPDAQKYTLMKGGGTALLGNLLIIDGAPDPLDDGVNIASHSLTLIDVAKLEVVSQTDAIAGMRFLEILPHNGRFYGLNYVRAEEGINAADTSLVAIEPGSPMTIERRPLALADAMRGAIDGNLLYVLHDGTHSEPRLDPETGEPLGYERDGKFYPYTDDTAWQALSTYDLTTGATELLWYRRADDPSIHGIDNPYPNASDIAIVGGEVILISNETDRLYRWDRARNVMQPVLALEEAGTLLLGNAQ